MALARRPAFFQVDDLAALADHPGELQDVVGILVLGGARQGVGVVVQGIGMGFGRPQLVVVRVSLLGILVGDDPSDRGEDLLHRGLVLLSRLGRHVTTSRNVLPRRRGARKPCRQSRRSPLTSAPRPIHRLRTSA